MSSGFCSLEEAFTAPIMPGKNKSSKKSKNKEHSVPGPLSGSPDPDSSVPEPMGPPPSSMAKTEANAVALNDFFPLPGETAEPEEWAKAFTLEGSQMPQMMRPDGSVPVGGKSTLWRKVPVPAAFSPSPPSTVGTPLTHSLTTSLPADIQSRLDALTKQLDSLTTATPMQSTAELFLFIAIGLLFLLAIDTLLRCATSIALAKNGHTGQKGGFRLGRGLNKAWRF
jgi:hypothetical protein